MVQGVVAGFSVNNKVVNKKQCIVTSKEEIITATIQSVAFQAYDLHQAMTDDGISPGIIRVDGGMASNNWFIQFLADVLNIPVERPKNIESTVLGVAYLAALSADILNNQILQFRFYLNGRICDKMGY